MAADPALLTTIVYDLPVSPCAKLPACVFATDRSGIGTIVVSSLAVSFASLASIAALTVATFVTIDGAAGVTFTVTVMWG